MRTEARKWSNAKDSVGCVGTPQMGSGTWRDEKDTTVHTKGTHNPTHTPTLSLREVTVIHCSSFDDLLPECSPTVTPARYTVGPFNPPAAHGAALLAELH